jgi:hypothetical protein
VIIKFLRVKRWKIKMSENEFKIKGKPPSAYSKRDYEDAVRHIVGKMEVGKERMRPLFEKKR